MKWLIILGLILLLIAVVAWHFRKHIQSAWFIYQTFRKMRQMRPPAEKPLEPKAKSGDTELVRCPKCGKWTPKDDAVKLKSDFFCSLACLEETMAFNRRQ